MRPGFETDFVSFVETGSSGPLGSSHPYLTIAQEIEAFAKTNYPGIPRREPGRRGATPAHPSATQGMAGHGQASSRCSRSTGPQMDAIPRPPKGSMRLLPFGTVETEDPWATIFDYRSPGKVSDFELASLGADGAEGGTGDDADITSWAEASLVARWFDYTADKRA